MDRKTLDLIREVVDQIKLDRYYRAYLDMVNSNRDIDINGNDYFSKNIFKNERKCAIIKPGTPTQRPDGGPGSGNFGHKGRPGEIGGSASGGGSKSSSKSGGREKSSKKESGGSAQKAVPKISRPAVPAPHKTVTSKEFVPKLSEAKSTCRPEEAWRVDTYRTAEDFDSEGIKVYTTDGGSTFAVKPDGDIISVCKNRRSDENLNARDIMAAAVERGGTHLDSYAGNYGFYVKCGFEVVSRCRFDEQFAPSDWDKNRDAPEDIYFMRYVGVGKVKDTSEKAMLSRVPYSADYDAAAKVLKGVLEEEKDG